ncbi:MAG: Wzt carbohydrate-binding domain-containing protein, partial [Anaerolineae bacterium]|nr:Wzt carbohydrate-binding domain-containing protein [Anaerolineae bacterium]
LAVHRNDGLHVCGPNTQFAGLDIPSIEGEGAILYRVDRLPLMEGTYLLSVSAHNQADTVMYDYHDRLYTFKVRQVVKGERYGLVSLEGEWEWNDGEMQ